MHSTDDFREVEYQSLYQQSIEDPENFWRAQAYRFIDWIQPFQTVQTGSFEQLAQSSALSKKSSEKISTEHHLHHPSIAWFSEGQLNACYNCVDRHLKKNADTIAIIWQGDDPAQHQSLTYLELHEKINRLANVFKKHGIQRGDRVCIYLPMIPEAVIAMLACARIGAIHVVVFAGFSAEALSARIEDADCKLVITADESLRGGKTIPLKQQVDSALNIKNKSVQHVIVVKRTGNKVAWKKNRDVWYHEVIEHEAAHCPLVNMNSEDPLFVLYTSGSTGKPKGVLHSTGGYLVYVAMTFHYVFNYHPEEIFWCTADVGWITGHSYGVYGPLANGATILIFEGVPNYPSFSRFFEIIDQHDVNIFYTAPTAIRALRREGDDWVKRTSRQSLRLLGTVGEPINPDVWQWFYEVVGDSRCPIVDTWWQTETGGILISPIPGAMHLKPGSVSKPFFGIVPEVVNDNGEKVEPNTLGKLIIKKPWPGMMKTIYGDHQRFIENYFQTFPGHYWTGDEASEDEGGDFFIRGRDDDVIKISGHRLGTEELESAFVSHPAVSESAVVEVPHEIKGHSIYAYVALKVEVKTSEKLRQELIRLVREKIGPIATPDVIQWVEALPKTRSGKIMRRLLRKIANGEFQDLGDTSTLAEPSVIDALIKGREE